MKEEQVHKIIQTIENDKDKLNPVIYLLTVLSIIGIILTIVSIHSLKQTPFYYETDIRFGLLLLGGPIFLILIIFLLFLLSNEKNKFKTKIENLDKIKFNEHTTKDEMVLLVNEESKYNKIIMILKGLTIYSILLLIYVFILYIIFLIHAFS